MPKRFGSKVVVIAGATSGIGEATAKRFASEGARVACLGRHMERGSRVAKQIAAQTAIEAIFVPCDVRDKQQVEQSIATVTSKFGRIDVLFNSAGIIPVRTCEELTEQEWDDCMDTNLKSIYLTSKYSLPWLRKTKGVIINTSSELGVRGAPNYTAYCASKAGVILFTKSLALECAPWNVRVNCISPGPTDTPMLESELAFIAKRDNTTSEKIRNALVESYIPLRRFASADEIANLVLYLASDEASFATGAAWSLDGGITSN